MPAWKPASTVFQGGTQQINALKGKRVRTKVNLLSAPLYDPVNNRQATAVVPQGALGFISNPKNDNLLVAFPKQSNSTFATLEALARSNAFFVVIINVPTFKLQFDVEV